MKASGIIAASLFGALVAAAPVMKRDVVWVTETAVDIVTVPVTKTVWVGADEATYTPAFNAAFGRPTHTRNTLTSSSTAEASESTSSSIEVAPTTSSSSSVYVEPTPSSTSVYVEPTPSTTSVYVEPTTTTSSSVYVAPTTSSTSVYVAPTTTSVYVAPTTTEAPTSTYVAPTTTEAPTSTYVAPTTTSSSAAPTSTAPSSGSSSGLAASGTSYTGDLTYYATGTGACGWDNTASDKIVAISQTIFDDAQYYQANPNNNPLCGRYVSITGKDGSQYQAKVVDRCVGCAEGDLDLSQDFFNAVTQNGDGRVHGVSWTWV